MVAEPGDLNCREASRLMSLACERPLEAQELRALKMHLDECLMCVNFEQQLKFLHRCAEVFRSGP
jgi:hypothetical protein